MNCIEKEKNDIISILNTIHFDELFEEIDKDCYININTLGNYHLYTISNIYKTNIIDKLRLLLDDKYEFKYTEILNSKYPELIIKSNINQDKYYGIYINVSYINNEQLKDNIILGQNDTFYFRIMDNVLFFKNILWFNHTIKTFSIMEIRIIPDPTYLSYFP